MTGKVNNFSNYPHGFQGGLTVRDIPVGQTHTGKIFFVADGDTAGNTPAVTGRKGASDGNKGTFLAPFKTLDYAIGQCLADRGDTIVVLPGYVDTLAAAAEIDVDVDGVTIIGIGQGDKQPLIQFDAAAATFEVNADNVTIMGLHFAASVTIVTIGVDVKDGSDDFRIENCRFSAQALTTDEFNDALFITTSDRFVIRNNYFDMDEAAAQSAIHIVGACLGGIIEDNVVLGDYAVANIEGVTAAAEQLVIRNNTLVNGVHSGLNAVANISLFTGTTGYIHDNRLFTNVASPASGAIVADAAFLANNSISTTAASPAIEAESSNARGVEVTMVATELTEAAETTALGAVNGPVDIYGIIGVISAAADTSQVLSVALESGTTLWASAEIAAATAAGDLLYSTTVGGVTTVAEIGNNPGLWPSPLRVVGTEDLIDFVTDANGVEGHAAFYTFWSPADGAAATEVQAT